ncbi:50S ribosomal protein L19 [Candidatus Parcubacteria bacterium]|nr:50S ribosomal protein L19 [Candidatus Parcubacteria bacterium]
MAITLSTLDKTTRKTLDLRTGDTIKVHQKIQEKGKTRIQIFEGMILARKHGSEAGATLTVRKSANGYGVERIFPLYSPMVDKIELVKRSKVRRAKLYYIRDKAVKEINKRLKMQMVRAPKKEVAAPDNDLLDTTPEDIDMEKVAEIEKTSE